MLVRLSDLTVMNHANLMRGNKESAKDLSPAPPVSRVVGESGLPVVKAARAASAMWTRV